MQLPTGKDYFPSNLQTTTGIMKDSGLTVLETIIPAFIQSLVQITQLMPAMHE